MPDSGRVYITGDCDVLGNWDPGAVPLERSADGSWTRSLTVPHGIPAYAHVKNLDDVEFSSAGELTIDKLESDELDVSLSGAGNVELNDIQATDLHVSLSG